MNDSQHETRGPSSGMSMGESSRYEHRQSEDSRLDQQKKKLIAQRQQSLDEITDTHDSLVRELFHMEKFVSMVAFDPQQAKSENSIVLQTFKAGYDLLQNSSVGPSRRTTRAELTERASLITSSPAPHNHSKNPKANARVINDILASATKKKATGNPELDSLSTFKGKGKARYQPIEDEKPSIVLEESISTVKTKRKRKSRSSTTTAADMPNSNDNDLSGPVRTSSRIANIGHVLRFDPISHGIILTPSRASSDGASSTVKSRLNNHFLMPPPAQPPEQKGLARSRKRKSTDSSTDSVESIPTQKRPKAFKGVSKNRSSAPSVLKKKFKTETLPLPLEALSAPTRIMPSRTVAPRMAKTPVNKMTTGSVKLDPSPSKTKVKKITLLVRKRPPTFSHPSQQPPRPEYDGSISRFLKSYKAPMFENELDLNEDDRKQMVITDAKLWEEALVLKRNGVFLARDFDPPIIINPLDPTNSQPGPAIQRSKDVWDYVVEAVIEHAQAKNTPDEAKLLAAQIPLKIRDYWQAKKVIEDKKIKTLAKMTMGLVTAQWKKAVYHIKEQKKMKLKAEEVQRGHDHLNALLNQSGNILERQHDDLARRSRSGSSSTTTTDDEATQADIDSGEDEPAHSEYTIDEAVILADESELGIRGRSASFTLSERSSLSPAVNSQDMLQSTPESPKIHNSPIIVVPDAKISLNGHDVTEFRTDTDIRASSSPLSIVPSDDFPFHPFVEDTTDVFNVSLLQTESDGCVDEVLVSQTDVDHSKRKLLGNIDEEYVLDSGTINTETSFPLLESRQINSHSSFLPLLDTVAEATTDGDFQMDTSEDNPHPNDEAGNESNDETDKQLIPDYLKPYAVAPVEWDSAAQQVKPPLLLRGVLRPYQQSGLEWLASLHANNLNGILADEMGLGKTIQTISLLAHLACDRGIWGPHLIIVPTSVLLNWEMEFKKFLPGFKIISYHGSTKRRKEIRQGWSDKNHFNVCITSYTLASKDARIFRRKSWYYMILDEAHMIKNFKSQRWNTLLLFRSFRRLLLTGTPLQNNLTELWALLQFLLAGSNFANLKEFGEWFTNPLEKAIEMGTVLDDDTMQRVSKLHTVLRPYLLRRLKRDVEKELPSKYEHLVLCPLSKRQRFLYDEFMSRTQTKNALESGIYQKIANILMQLRKVCNHPDLFEVRPIVTSFAMTRSAIADFEIQELFLRRRLLATSDADVVSIRLLGLEFISRQNTSMINAMECQALDATHELQIMFEGGFEPAPAKDIRTINGFKTYQLYQVRAARVAQWAHRGYVNRLRCQSPLPIYSEETIRIVRSRYTPLCPLAAVHADRTRPAQGFLERPDLINSTIKSYAQRASETAAIVDTFVFVTPAVVTLDMPTIVLGNVDNVLSQQSPSFDSVLHRASVKLQIAFPEASLLQFDCGKLQRLATLLRDKKIGGHRVLIFTQMTKILDILEIFLNLHGYLYLRLDGSTKIEDRQYITERFNADTRVFCFIASSRSGGVGINLTGADTVVFYDSDFNPQMDRQCEDRAHRIGQIRDVHIYRFVSQHTVEEAMLRKANQKRSLDDLVIQKGQFDWRTLLNDGSGDSVEEESGPLTKALAEFEETEDAQAARFAAKEEGAMMGADSLDFCGDIEPSVTSTLTLAPECSPDIHTTNVLGLDGSPIEGAVLDSADDDEEAEGHTISDYMCNLVLRDYDYFREWRV